MRTSPANIRVEIQRLRIRSKGWRSEPLYNSTLRVDISWDDKIEKQDQGEFYFLVLTKIEE